MTTQAPKPPMTELPFAELLGARVTEVTPDRVVGEMVVRPELCTTPAVLHGGAVMAFADTLGALGTVANLPAGAGTTTIESKTNFLGAAPVGSTVIGTATPVHRGRRTQVWQTRVTTPEGRLVALVTQPSWCSEQPGCTASVRVQEGLLPDSGCGWVGMDGVARLGWAIWANPLQAA